MPSWSGVGNISPVSTTTIRSSYSTTVMFLPISPSPPSGRTRSVPLRAHTAASRPLALERRADAARSSLARPRRAAGAAPPTSVAEHVQRGLDRDRVGGDRERLVQRQQRLLDLRAARRARRSIRRISAPDQVRGHQDPARAAHVEHLGEHVVVAGEQVEPVDRREVLVAGLLDRHDVVDLGRARRAGRSACRSRERLGML